MEHQYSTAASIVFSNKVRADRGERPTLHDTNRRPATEAGLDRCGRDQHRGRPRGQAYGRQRPRRRWQAKLPVHNGRDARSRHHAEHLRRRARRGPATGQAAGGGQGPGLLSIVATPIGAGSRM